MDVISDTPFNNQLKTVKYATTPRMSTYLLAFIVGPFEYIEGFTTGEYNGRPIKTRVYTLPGLSEQGRHALNVGMETLEYFAKVFDLPYPLPKLDMVAIPDFDAGAMENWGLVTFRTTAVREIKIYTIRILRLIFLFIFFSSCTTIITLPLVPRDLQRTR